jgi:phage gp16-like protein
MEGHPYEAQLRKVYALLTDQSLSWEYSDGMAARMYGQKRTEQLKPNELRGLIAALTKRQQKHGGRREPAHV